MASIVAATWDALMPGGVDSSKTSIDSLKIGQAPRTITPTTSKLTSGSKTVQPVRKMAAPLENTYGVKSCFVHSLSPILLSAYGRRLCIIAARDLNHLGVRVLHVCAR